MTPDPARFAPHPALAVADGAALAAASCTDQARVALLLEGGALLSHLRSAGWCLDAGWEGAVVTPAGHLGGVAGRPGAAAWDAAPELLDLVAALFGQADVGGSGAARRAVRLLVDEWRSWPGALSADEAVGRILAVAPFLWKRRFAASRGRLVARRGSPAEPTWEVAGPSSLRRLLRELGGPRLRDRLRSARGPTMEPDAGAVQVREGSVAAPRLRRLYLTGAWRELRTALGRRGGAGGEDPSLSLYAAEAFVRGGRSQSARDWVRRAALEGGTRPRAAGLLRAWVEIRLGGSWSTPQDFPASPLALGEDWWACWAVVGRALSRRRLVESELTRVLARRRTAGVTRGRLWCELAALRGAAGRLRPAERAYAHAHRWLRRCAGADAAAEALAGLAETRLRRGRLQTVGAQAAAIRRAADRSGDRRLRARAGHLRLRLLLARGDAEAVAASLEPRARRGRLRPPERLFLARALGWLSRRGDAARELEGLPPAVFDAFELEERAMVWALAGRSDRAAEVAAAGGWEGWRRLVERGDLDGLRELSEPRRAWVIHDVRLLGVRVEPAASRAAVRSLRALGAVEAAGRLEAAVAGPWRALRRFLDLPRATLADLETLVAGGGHDDVRFVWRPGTADEPVVVGGRGGSECVAEELPAGHLEMRAPSIDDFLLCVFRILVDRLHDRLPGAGPRRAAPRGDALVGESIAFREAIAKVDLLAPSRFPVLLEGETGTGKELAARRVHAGSERSGSRFLPINCAALPESLLLSELFGHARGSFTGAHRDHAGVFETARGGTVFLDEIGDMPLPAQGSLLRVLQEGEVRRLGETSLRAIDVRIVAATHRDLERRVEDGAFRRDLYYRLKAARVSLPPLRDRGGDVMLLARHFLLRCSRPVSISADARQALETHDWPGNVRELKNTIEVAEKLCGTRPSLQPSHLDLPPQTGRAVSRYHEALQAERRRLVSLALKQTGGRKVSAARQLGITPQALSYLLRRLDLPGLT